MPVAFIDRNPTKKEIDIIKLCMSSFCDGFGQEKDKNGMTRPGWRDLERIIGEVLGGHCPENKCIFDVIVKSQTSSNTLYGIDVKSKSAATMNSFNKLLDFRVS